MTGSNKYQPGCPAVSEYMNAGIAPCGTPGEVTLASGFNAPLIMAPDTPAAMKSPTPLPNPHLDTTSSKNIMSIPPMVICRISNH